MAKYCIGIDLGGTFIKFSTLDEKFQPGETQQLPTPSDAGCDGVVAQMVAGASKLMEARCIGRENVLGVGIGSPGPINISEGIVVATPNIPGMENCRLRAKVSEGLNLPAVLENDANAAAYGEFVSGAGMGTRNMVLLTLGTGLGSGIIVDRKILHGSHDAGGELGHMIVQPGGELCGCGQRGCLEQYCSATFIARRATRMINEGRKSSLKETIDKIGSIDAKDINEARKAGDALAGEVWDNAAYYLALGCVSICRIFDPDRIVLAGGLTKAGDDLMEPVRRHFEKLHWTITEPSTKIAIASLGNDAGAIGAAGAAWQEFGN